MTTGGAGELWPGAGPSNAIAGSSSSGGVSALRYRQRLSPGLDDVALGSKRGSVASIASPAAPSPPPHGLPVDDAEGHFIVRPGDSVTARYKILSQLGQGTFGKVVECYDRSERRRVAIKVIRAIQKYRDASQIEIRVLRTLRQNDPNNENQCIHLLSTFSYRNHVCIVSELLGKSVFDFLKENEFHPFPSTHIWSFAKQLLKSVAFLHSLNLVHTDLKPENILLVDSDYVSKPYSSRYPNSKKWRILKNTEIRLIDFGSATFDNEYHSAVVSTRHYRAPEIILGMGWSFPCDVWSIGCILVEFHTGDALFQTHDNLEHLAMMEAVLGMMPDDFRRKAETYKADLFKDGHLDYPNAKTSKTSKKYVRGMRKLSDTISYSSAYNKHNTRFLHLLRRLLEFDPDKRITVEEALSHPYFSLHANDFPA
ncbi:kinase-like protein [Tilletiaria anomala UBC 951]|uniref:Kinase-like protein n=1 Tax=Tilletiaria anomala (strain ATCC 24038 / CBS 436.72 / UBC 951) TaxID=1037660 RepID=A0A066WHC3_TILAU|nr:kinase-like protein [Tilletiaria anomala UBC 951]KDN53372.1 kinase-like protein [Tilletiaria anomala UBC 951]